MAEQKDDSVSLGEVYRVVTRIEGKVDKLNSTVQDNKTAIAVHETHLERVDRLEDRVDELDGRVKLFGAGNAVLTAIAGIVATALGRTP